MSEPVLTIDIDWAPDFVIDWVSGRLIEAGVRATWMVTHASPAVDRLRGRPDLFELGIHPNFLSRSTHGQSQEDVLRHCLALVPDAACLRTHGLVQSTAILDLILTQTAIRADLSLFLPHARLSEPVEYWWEGRKLVRIPYVWEDDFEMMRPAPVWQFDELDGSAPGFAVLDFHPIHVYLNQPDLKAYDELKRRSGNLHLATPAQAADLIGSGAGPRTMFDSVVERLRRTGGRRVSDLVSPGRPATTGRRT
jgi:hypothetical protein